jgi:hypothetical protein
VRTEASVTAEQDGKRVRIGFGQDPGQAGKSQALHLVRALDGQTGGRGSAPRTAPEAGRAWVARTSKPKFRYRRHKPRCLVQLQLPVSVLFGLKQVCGSWYSRTLFRPPDGDTQMRAETVERQVDGRV